MASKGIVLVTGANGFIGAQIVDAFLKAGHSVRGTVRSEKSGAGLLTALSQYTKADSSPKFELSYVSDITAPGAFTDALKGVSAVVHLAQPVSMGFTEADPVINTSVNATKSIVQSALHESSIKSFVYMGSIVAIITFSKQGVATEADWNDEALAVVKAKGDDAPGPLIYAASKVQAEREFWRLTKEAKASFSSTVLNPTFVGGPPLITPTSPDQVSETIRPIYEILAGHAYPPPPVGYGTYVDVRDVARLAVFAVEQPAVADGQRYIVGGNGNDGHPQAMADILREAYPDRKGVIVEGTPGQGYEPGYKARDPAVGRVINSDKAVKATGQDWIPYDQMVRDTAKAFEGLL